MFQNKVIEKLRSEFTELGDENTKLRADSSRFKELHGNQEQLLNSANVNQEDLGKDFQVYSL